MLQLQAGGHLLAVLCDQNSWQHQQQQAATALCLRVLTSSRPGRAAELHTGTGQNISQILPLLIFIYVFQETPNTKCDKVFRLRGPASRGRPDQRIINVETRTNCANNSANNSCLRNWLPIASCPSARYNLLGIGQGSMQPCWTK